MKAYLCDVCLTEGNKTSARFALKIKKGFESLRVDICGNHKAAVKGKGYDAMLDLLVKSESMLNQEVLA